MSAELLLTPGIWEVVIFMLKMAVKNQRHLSRCITISSLEEPLLMASTKLLLSQWNSTLLFENRGPHTAPLKMMGTSPLAIILTEDQPVGHVYWNQCSLKHLHNSMSQRHLSRCGSRQWTVDECSQRS